MSEQASIEGQTIIKAVAEIFAAFASAGKGNLTMQANQDLWNFFEKNLDEYKKKHQENP